MIELEQLGLWQKFRTKTSLCVPARSMERGDYIYCPGQCVCSTSVEERGSPSQWHNEHFCHHAESEATQMFTRAIHTVCSFMWMWVIHKQGHPCPLIAAWVLQGSRRETPLTVETVSKACFWADEHRPAFVLGGRILIMSPCFPAVIKLGGNRCEPFTSANNAILRSQPLYTLLAPPNSQQQHWPPPTLAPTHSTSDHYHNIQNEYNQLKHLLYT